MLSEDAIENLVKPIVDRQEKLNLYVIEVIAQRVKEIGHLLPSDVYKLERLLKMGGDVRKINEEIARLTGLNEKAIKQLIKVVAQDAYKDAKPYYDYRHKAYIPYYKNIPLQRVVKAIEKQTLGTYKNLSNSTAFMIRDLKNPTVLKPTSIAKTYQSVIDEAVQAAQSGTIDYNTAMRRTMKQLNDSGIRYVTYSPESGRRYTQRLDTAVRRNILDGIRQLNQGVQDEVGKQYGADGKEITVHAFSAPDHEPIQGHQFSNGEYTKLQSNQPFKDANGKSFDSIERAIGMWNCRHFAFSIILGISKPNYTEEQLKEINKKNNEGYTLPNGKHLTMYECTQYQRAFEIQIRKAKDGQMMAQAEGDKKLAQDYQRQVNDLTNQYKQFTKACGLNLHMEKARVAGYKKISTKA